LQDARLISPGDATPVEGFRLEAIAPGQVGYMVGTSAGFGPASVGSTPAANGFFVTLADMTTTPSWLPAVTLRLEIFGGSLTGPAAGAYTVGPSGEPTAGAELQGVGIGYYADSGTIVIQETPAGQLAGVVDVWLSKNRVVPNDGPEPLRVRGSFVADTARAPATIRRGAAHMQRVMPRS